MISYPIKPEKLVTDVRNAFDENDVVISDVGAHKLWIAKVYNTYSPNTCLITNDFCSMGFALPGAIVSLQDQKQKVVAMCGDAGFLMKLTRNRDSRSIKTVNYNCWVWCDSDLGMISLKQIDEFGKERIYQI